MTKLLIRFVGALFGLLALGFVYFGATYGPAMYRARGFCAAIAIGSAIDDFESRALAAGFKRVVRTRPFENGGVLMAETTGFPFITHYCNVEHQDGRITRAWVSSIN